MQLKINTLPGLCAAILMGICIHQSAMAETRTKYFIQSSTVNDYNLNGAGVELSILDNGGSGIFYSASLSAGNGVESGEDRHISILDLTIGKSLDDGWALFGGLSINSYEINRATNNIYGGLNSTANEYTKANGLFFGLGVTKPVGLGIFSMSGSLFSGNLTTEIDYQSCINQWPSSGQQCSMYYGEYDEPISGFVYTLAYAFPITDSMTFGFEHKSREFTSEKLSDFELKLNRVFLDIAFR